MTSELAGRTGRALTLPGERYAAPALEQTINQGPQNLDKEARFCFVKSKGSEVMRQVEEPGGP